MRSVSLFLTAGLLAAAIAASAQSPRKLDYGINFAGGGQKIAVDAGGNTYVAGSFGGSQTFGPFNFTSHDFDDVIVLKVDPSGAIVDAAHFGSDDGFTEVNDISVDAAGNIILVGSFTAQTDFDPAGGGEIHSPVGPTIADGYILKLTPALDFDWVGTIGGEEPDKVSGIATDASSNIFITGSFTGEADLDPTSLVDAVSLSGENAFFIKLQPDGDVEWIKTVSNDTFVEGTGVAVDFAGNPVFAGRYTIEVNINPDGTEDLDGVGESDVFILKLGTGTGNFSWGKSIGGDSGDNFANSIATDGQNNVYVTGFFLGTGDFNPDGSIVTQLSSNGDADIFVTKFNQAGALVWARSFGGEDYDNGSGVFATTTDVYVTGVFSNEADFGTAGDHFLEAFGDFDSFLLNLDNNGNLKWVEQLGGDAYDIGSDVAVDNADNVYALGYFESLNGDLDPTCELLELDPEIAPTYLIRIGNDPTDCITIVSQPVGSDGCAGDVIVLTVEATGTGITYQWMMNDSDGGFQDVEDVAGLYSGSDTPTLTITTTDDYDGEGVYVVMLSKAGEEVFSDEAFVNLLHEPYVNDIVNCGPGAVTITATGGPNGQYRWYTTASGGTAISGETSASYTTPFLAITTHYWVSINNGTCESPRAEVIVNITACEPAPGLRWAKAWGGPNIDEMGKVLLLSDGNLLIPGIFSETVDFDQNPATTENNLTADGRDGFFMKVTPNGELIWVRQITGTGTAAPSFAAEDASGNIYISGHFNGTSDFDPDPAAAAVANVNGGPNTQDNIFIIRYDANGLVVTSNWIHHIGLGTRTERISDMKVDASGLYITGHFWEFFAIDGSLVAPTVSSAGGTDVFVMKMALNNGSTTWLRTIGNSFASGNVITEASDGIALHGDDLFLYANCSPGSTDLDPTSGTFPITSVDGDPYIVKLDVDGNFQTAFRYTMTAGSSNGANITVDDDGFIYTTGQFLEGTVDFGGGVTLENPSGSLDAFIVKHQPNGTVVWAKKFDTIVLNYVYGGYLQIFENGDVLIGGMFGGTIDFDPGPLEYTMSGNSLFLNSYLVKLNEDGEFNWAVSLARIDNVSSSAGGAVPLILPNGDIIMTGSIRGSVDFDPLDCEFEVNSALQIPNNYSQDFYLWNLSFNAANICFASQPVDQDICANADAFFTAEAVGAPGITYQWQIETSSNVYENVNNGSVYSGATTYQLKVTTTGGVGGGRYRVIASAPNATARESFQAELTFDGTRPDAPTTEGAATCLTSASLTLRAFGSDFYRWYDVPSGGIAIDGADDTFVTPVLTSSKTYYVVSTTETCESVRVPVTATIDAGNTPPTVSDGERCGDGPVTLTASGAADGQFRWYTTEVGGVAIPQTDGTFTTPSIFETTSYYVAIQLPDCESPRVEAVATVNPAPVGPNMSGASICAGATAALTAPTSVGETRWYTFASGGSPFHTGTSFTTPALTITTTYHVAVFVDDCESTRTPVVVTVTDCATNQPPVIAPANPSINVGGTLTFDLTPYLSDPDNNLDLTTLKIVVQPSSGAHAEINEIGQLTIDYTGSSFVGEDVLTIEVCDIAGVCVQRQITIVVASDFVVYNAVSPNEDGKNDVFFIAFIDAFEATRNNHVYIFNRWGSLVFDVENYNNTTKVFSGIANSGGELPSGTYYYKIEFSDRNRKTETGFLSLKR